VIENLKIGVPRNKIFEKTLLIFKKSRFMYFRIFFAFPLFLEKIVLKIVHIILQNF